MLACQYLALAPNLYEVLTKDQGRLPTGRFKIQGIAMAVYLAER
jgi:hypothetical protein